jgi:hypothetical protein
MAADGSRLGETHVLNLHARSFIERFLLNHCPGWIQTVKPAQLRATRALFRPSTA